MTILVACAKCGFRYKLKDELAGKKVKCKECQTVFVVYQPALPMQVERSESGGPIYRHAERQSAFTPATGDNENIELISEHITRYCGKVETVLHEIVSDLVHIDVHWVAPTRDRPFHTFVTSGMSDLPMAVPDGAEDYRFAELMLALPESWPISMEAFKDERNYWPIRCLKTLARFSHEYQTWLCWGHTVPNGDPPKPFASNTELCCALLLSPLLADEGFTDLVAESDKIIRFYSLVPVYREEMDLKLQKGTDPLVERLVQQHVSELLNPQRANVCKKKGWW